VDSSTVRPDAAEAVLGAYDGILVPGGFGERGTRGKFEAVRYARENGVPFFGICLGMQCAVIEFARDMCNFEGANSSEFDSSTPYPVIDLMPEQRNVAGMGGSMRLGAYPCKLRPGTAAHYAYGISEISERHRHRYEFNNLFRESLEVGGMVISGTSPDDSLVEIVEIKDHPWFVGCQFHPELKSRPRNVHPLFREFVAAAKGYRMRTRTYAGGGVAT
jgi:CTP synthase